MKKKKKKSSRVKDHTVDEKFSGTHRYSYDIIPSPSKRVVDNNNLNMIKKHNN